MPDQRINAIDKALVRNGDRLQPKRGFALSRWEGVTTKRLVVVFNGQIDRTAEDIRPSGFTDGTLKRAGVKFSILQNNH